MSHIKINLQLRGLNDRKSDRYKGISMVLSGATLWGVSGTAAQVLLQQDGFSAEWLVTIRMSLSGILLLMIIGPKLGKTRLFSMWRSRLDGVRIVIFAIVGLVGVQYSYFAAIQVSNAATATLLQYLSPTLITLYVAVRSRKTPTRRQVTAVALAFIGTGLLVTSGSFGGLSISKWAVAWGLISAVTAAFYIVYPQELLQRYGPATLIGWGMTIGGFLFMFIAPPWRFQGHLTLISFLLVLFVILFGTLVAFYLYLGGLHYISPSEVSVLGCAEPLSASIIGLLLLNVDFSVFGIIGGICIVSTVIILAKAAK